LPKLVQTEESGGVVSSTPHAGLPLSVAVAQSQAELKDDSVADFNRKPPIAGHLADGKISDSKPPSPATKFSTQYQECVGIPHQSLVVSQCSNHVNF
jgi:hypothetical protein